MDDLFVNTILTKSFSIEPKYINNNINDYLLKKLRDQYEERCTKDGYIRKNSIKILKRSLGKVLASQFNGNVLYNLKFSVELCNPPEGAIMNVHITNINKMGILASVSHYDTSPLNIILAKQHHIDNDNYLALKIGDEVSIKIIGKRFEFGDSQISIIAVLE